ncbi:MAG: hypothetical protein ACQXXJ_07695 [Candidatus Bathyarchaeia archaeon]|jgi:5-methyltetrahydropteroyltriglutamate--homocysteine methyltransferase
MELLVDDVGSFPLPPFANREKFNAAYQQAREAMQRGQDCRRIDFIRENFCEVTLDAFKQKLRTGLDVVNYPQQYSGINQLGDAIHRAMERGTFLVEEKDAFLPEVRLIEQQSKELSEEYGKKILLRVSLFGPMEQYLKEVGTGAYVDVLDEFAETVRRFAKNSVLNTKYVKTEVVSLDEPSFGFLNISAENETIRRVLNKAFDFQGATRQIHLHSPARLPDLLNVQNLDVLSFEYAASPKNIEGLSKKMFEESDKHVRVGVSRTDIDTIVAELYDRGIDKPTAAQLVDSEELIQKRFRFALEKFGERMSFAGPDCGLGSWPSQEAARLLLERTVRAIKSA